MQPHCNQSVNIGLLLANTRGMNKISFPFKLSVLAIALFAIVAFFPVSGHAQTTDGNVVGTVVDSTGAVVPNAKVDAVNTATGVKTSTQSNSSGEYRFNNLPAGKYDITANAPGFATAKLASFSVDLNKTATGNLTMPLAGTSTSIEVSAAGGNPIDTTTAQVTNT